MATHPSPREFVRGLILGEEIETPYYGKGVVQGVFANPDDYPPKAYVEVWYYDSASTRRWASEKYRDGSVSKAHPLEALMPQYEGYTADCPWCGGEGEYPVRDRGSETGESTEPCGYCEQTGTFPPTPEEDGSLEQELPAKLQS